MTYTEAVFYLESFINYEKTPPLECPAAFKLERMQKLLSHLGNPQDSLKAIHVAGTKGKGSTACFIASILAARGLRVGLYTSPHLQDFRERVRVLDSVFLEESFSGMISENDFAALLESIYPQIEFLRHSLQPFGSPTFFEIITAMAFLYFKNKKVEAAVLETGLGGRFDATNTVGSLLSVLTPVSYDHQRLLGTTLTEIAFEKAGILKEANARTKEGARLCVSAPQHKEVNRVLKRRAQTQGHVFLQCGKAFGFKRMRGNMSGQEFFYTGLNNEPLFLKIKMLGQHQLVNASVAAAACQALSLHGIDVDNGAIVRGISRAFWPARLEVLQSRPFIILDGAHNTDSANCLARFLRKEFKDFRRWLVLGACVDKDIQGIVDCLEPAADKIILTRAANSRAAHPGQMRSFFKKSAAVITDSVGEALGILKNEMRQGDMAVVTGSLFVAAEARTLWTRNQMPEGR